jgi:hypothetical protein
MVRSGYKRGGRHGGEVNRPGDEAAARAAVERPGRKRAKRSKATQQASSAVSPTTVNHELINDSEFVLAMARYAGGLETEAAIRKRYNFDDDTWNRLSDNEILVAKILETQRCRIANGSTARERAQVLHATAPLRVGEILNSPTVSPRSVIEASKEIRAIAGVTPEAAANADKFQIIINMGEETLRFDKTIAAAPPNTIEATAGEDGDGQPV